MTTKVKRSEKSDWATKNSEGVESFPDVTRGNVTRGDGGGGKLGWILKRVRQKGSVREWRPGASIHPVLLTSLLSSSSSSVLLLGWSSWSSRQIAEWNDGRRGAKRCKQGEQDRRRRGESRRSWIWLELRWFDVAGLILSAVHIHIHWKVTEKNCFKWIIRAAESVREREKMVFSLRCAHLHLLFSLISL